MNSIRKTVRLPKFYLKILSHYWNVQSKKFRFFSFAICMLVSFSVGILFFDSISLSLAMVFLYPAYIKKSGEIFIKEKHKQLKLEFKDFLYSLSDSFEHTEPINIGILKAMENNIHIYKKNHYISDFLKGYESPLKNNLISGEEVFRILVNELKIEEAYNIMNLYEMSKDSGGNLIDAIRNTTDIICEKILLENRVGGILKQKKIEGIIIGTMPFAIIFLMRVSITGYFDPLYNSFYGNTVMVIALLGLFFSWIWIEKITGIEI